MNRFINYIFFLVPALIFAQFEEPSSVGKAKYFEDQIYIGINYNFLGNKPDDVFQRNFSYGLQGGLIRDIPISNSGRVALGVGIGYAVNSYYSNIISTKTDGIIIYELAANGFEYNRSKFETHGIEFPLEFRWRNSTATRYKFFRVYSGIKFDYNFSNRSKLVTDSGKIGFTNTDVNRFQYGLTLNVGYNTFNLHVYYSLTDFLEKGTQLTSGENFAIQPFRIGLIFYVL